MTKERMRVALSYLYGFLLFIFMIEYFLTIVAGGIQGLTEFLPISSSGHLIILHEFFRIGLMDELTFDVVLHLGTLTALLVFFWKDVVRLFRNFFKSLREKKIGGENKMPWLILWGTLPAVIVGYFFEDLIEFYLRNSLVIVITLILGSLFFFGVEKWGKKKEVMEELNLKKAGWIGVAQAVALIPGVSRSGITIATGMTMGLKREEAARFSFLLAMPIILGAGLKKILELESFSLGWCNLALLSLGFFVAAGVGFLVIKYLLKFLGKHSLAVFAWYRIILAIIILGLIVF